MSFVTEMAFCSISNCRMTLTRRTAESATGTFDHAQELYIGALDDRGVTGVQVVTPLTLASGRILLVNRGFVPEAREKPATSM